MSEYIIEYKGYSLNFTPREGDGEFAARWAHRNNHPNADKEWSPFSEVELCKTKVEAASVGKQYAMAWVDKK